MGCFHVSPTSSSPLSWEVYAYNIARASTCVDSVQTVSSVQEEEGKMYWRAKFPFILSEQCSKFVVADSPEVLHREDVHRYIPKLGIGDDDNDDDIVRRWKCVNENLCFCSSDKSLILYAHRLVSDHLSSPYLHARDKCIVSNHVPITVRLKFGPKWIDSEVSM